MPLLERPYAPDNATLAARPGLILLAMAIICAVLVLILPVGILIILHQNSILTIGNFLKLGWMSLSTLVAILSPPRPIMLVLAIPSVLVIVFSIVFLIAFRFRAAWGPRVLSALAILWAVSVSASTILLPLLGMPGPLPVFTFLGMLPGLIAPLLFAIGFAGFMLHGDVARAWFGTAPKDARA